MSYSWKDRIRNFAGWQRVGAFAITIAVIYAFLPAERLFKFEYQQNQPWQHEKLLAPFDFGIQKTAEEIKTQREEIEANQPPVFIIDNAVTDRIIESIDRSVRAQFPDSSISCDSMLADGFEFITQIMSSGLIQRNHEAVNTLKPFDEVYIYKDEQLVKTTNHKALSVQQVIDTINQFTNQQKDSLCARSFASATTDNLEFNALYNDSLTNMLLENALSELVTIEGKVDKGTTIIDKGDRVTDDKFKILQSLKAEYENRTVSGSGFHWSIVGELGIIISLLSLLVLYIYMNQSRLFNDPRPVTLTLSLIAVLFILCRLAFSSTVISVYAIPIGIAPLLLRMFYDFKVSIFTFVVLVLVVALFSSNPLEFSVIQISAISFATLYQASSTKRSRMLGTATLVFAGYTIIYVFLSLAQNGSWSGLDTGLFGWFAINALLCTLVFPLIYVVEKIFGYVSETTLLELSDSNQPLLKELAIKAPGTFQHSLQVANLCEKVAAKIGGSTVLLRTAAMYHDTGKMNEPQFFIENQIPENNPHDDLEPEESAAIIINHVIKGVEHAKRHHLPMDIVQFIQTHHGTSRVRFFLKKATEKAEAAGLEVDETLFRYSGPTPKTKEQAILMMCDSVEAASRSLKKYDRESLETLVNRLIDSQREEGQFESAPITLKDISDAKSVLKSVLNGIYHQRISYD